MALYGRSTGGQHKIRQCFRSNTTFRYIPEVLLQLLLAMMKLLDVVGETRGGGDSCRLSRSPVVKLMGFSELAKKAERRKRYGKIWMGPLRAWNQVWIKSFFVKAGIYYCYFCTFLRTKKTHSLPINFFSLRKRGTTLCQTNLTFFSSGRKQTIGGADVGGQAN